MKQPGHGEPQFSAGSLSDEQVLPCGQSLVSRQVTVPVGQGSAALHVGAAVVLSVPESSSLASAGCPAVVAASLRVTFGTPESRPLASAECVVVVAASSWAALAGSDGCDVSEQPARTAVTTQAHSGVEMAQTDTGKCIRAMIQHIACQARQNDACGHTLASG